MLCRVSLLVGRVILALVSVMLGLCIDRYFEWCSLLHGGMDGSWANSKGMESIRLHTCSIFDAQVYDIVTPHITSSPKL